MSDEESTADLTAERRPSIGAGWRPAPDAAKEIRDTVLRHVEAQRASLEQLRRQIQKSQMDQEGGDALDWIEQRLTFLDGIEATANSAPLPALLSLSFAMPAIATATATVLSAAKAEAAMQIGTAMGEMSTEAYHHYSHALEARVRNTDAVNGRHFQSAMGTLDRHGLGGHFRHVQSSLEAEREEAEKRGEHGKARVADSLIAHNTLVDPSRWVLRREAVRLRPIPRPHREARCCHVTRSSPIRSHGRCWLRRPPPRLPASGQGVRRRAFR